MNFLKKIKSIIVSTFNSLVRFYRFCYSNRYLLGAVVIFYVGMIAGEYRDLLNTYLGHNYDSSRVGQNVRVTGDCLFNNGSRVTLTNDQVRVIKKDKNRVYGIVVAMGKSVSCSRQNIVVEPYTYAQYLLDKERPILRIDEPRTNEIDPEIALLKKTVLMSGTCKDLDGNNKNLKSSMVEILSVEGDFDRVFNVFQVVNSRTLRCESKYVKSRLVKDEDVAIFEEEERSRLAPKGPVDLVGKVVDISGSCTLVNPANKKEVVSHFRGHPVLVLGVQKEGSEIMVLRGSTAYDKYDAIPVVCDKNKEPDVYWSLSDKPIERSNGEPKKNQIVSVTGVCVFEDGKKETFFEQSLKASSIEEDERGSVEKVIGYIKIKEEAKKVICDKKTDKSLQFDIK